MCHRCEEKKTCTPPPCPPPAPNVEVSKKLIYLCENPALAVTSILAYAITVRNNSDAEIKLTSLIDPVLAVTPLAFAAPVYSDVAFAASINVGGYFATGEIILLAAPITLGPGCVGIFTFTSLPFGCQKLSLCNFAYLKYSQETSYGTKVTLVKAESPEIKLDAPCPCPPPVEG